MKVKSVEATPNPNAKKFTLERVISGSSKSFLSSEAAASDPLAAALFAIAGVESVLILHDFITVNKMAATEWKTLTPTIKKLLSKL